MKEKPWNIEYIEEAEKDLEAFDHSIQKIILCGIIKASLNPLPRSEGGYGYPLGKRAGGNLTGFLKIKYRGIGIRVVYSIERNEREMKILVVDKREDGKCYEKAVKRRRMHFKKNK